MTIPVRSREARGRRPRASAATCSKRRSSRSRRIPIRRCRRRWTRRVRAMRREAGLGQPRLRGRGDLLPGHRQARPARPARSRAADALYDDFKTQQPAVLRRRARRAQLRRSCTASRSDKKHLDLAKHYLDIRGLENSVNRSRHNQSYKPVLEQSEAVGHAVNCVTLMVSLADVGVLTGLKEYFDAAQRMWTDAVDAEDVRHRRRRHDRQRRLRRAVRRCRTSPPTPRRAPC